MKKIITTLLCGCLSITSILAQNIKFRIVGEGDQLPLVHASVAVLTADSAIHASSISDDKGLVNIKIEITHFQLFISYLGYEDIYLTITNSDKQSLDLGSIVMKSKDHQLGEVVVAAQSVVKDINKSIIFPSLQQRKASTSGIDLLQQLQLPGLFVDPVNQKVSIRNRAGVTYRINGVNASFTEVIALKSSQIQRIEYSDNPSARELDTDMGVINFILKNDNTGTYMYVDALGAFSTGFLNSVFNLKTIASKSQFSLDYNVNWRDYSERWSNEKVAYLYPLGDTLSYNKQGRNAPFGYLTQDITFSYLYNTSTDKFIAKFQNALHHSTDRNYVDVFNRSSLNPMLFQDIYAKYEFYRPSLDLYYIRKIDEKNGIEANLVGTLTNTNYDRTLTDTYDHEEAYHVYNHTDGDRKSLIFESFFYNKKHAVNYHLGIKGAFNHTVNTYNVADQSRIKQLNFYPYASIEGKIKQVAYSIGIGMQILDTRDDLMHKTYYRNLSTLSFFYKRDKWNIENVSQYTPSYPQLAFLNNVDQRQDSLLVIRGNPWLKPSQTLSNRLNFSYQLRKDISTNLTLRASKTFDPIRDSYSFDNMINSFIAQKHNQTDDQQLGASLDVRASSVLKIFNIGGGTSWNNYQSKGESYSHQLDDISWYAFCNMQIKSFSLDVGYSKASRELYGQIISLNENYSSLGVTYKKNQLTASAGCMYPLTSGTKYGTQLTSSAVQSNKYVYIRDNANMIYIRLAYTLSWGKSMFGVNKKINNMDWDNGIIRVKDN